MITERDIAVWLASAFLAVGIGWSRYAKAKARNDFVRQMAAMDPERRAKMLRRLDPKTSMEIRQQLLERFQIMS